ncbi:MAG TPA: exodeoxyribonuclease VII large subunit [Bacteroidales bacterium]|nr:exodeoxyribonuclease VII large subunit [Bacteroidales bacterium]
MLDDKISLTELQLIIKDSLYIALPDFYWVVAEISEMKENNAGHCYLELVEKLPDEKNARAKVKAIIWGKRSMFLKSFFKNSTGETLREGMKVLVRVKIEYHELFGLSLIISDIDPSFTIGEMAIKRQMIINKLEEEGVFSMNKEIPFPAIPQRIAVISSGKAAGYSDFLNHLSENSYGYVFYTALFESAMQGTETEKNIISALDRIADHINLFDVVAIIRGGGSQSDLSWFDSYNIAFHVTQFPLPVITGIGHEKDLSVTDMVAFQSLKTPTAVADYLIDSVANAEDRLNEISSEISEYSKEIINYNKERVESSRVRLIPAAKLLVAGEKELLSGKIIKMINTGKEYILKAGIVPANHKSRLVSSAGLFSSAKYKVLDRMSLDLVSRTSYFISKKKVKTDSLENSLLILDPANVLKRGYSITSLNGRIIKSSFETSENDIIDTKFSDGAVKSKVI